MSKPDLYLIPATDEAWSWYCARCQEQYNSFPMRTDKMVFVGSETCEEPVASCVLIHTDGPYLIASWVIVNDLLEPADRYNAAVFLQDELKKLSLMLNRTIMVFSNHPGLSKVVDRHGFSRLPAELWYFSPASTYVHPQYEVSVMSTAEVDEGLAEALEEPRNGNGGKTWAEQSTQTCAVDSDGFCMRRQDAPKRKPGRPKGSKNKRTLERERKQREQSGNSSIEA